MKLFLALLLVTVVAQQVTASKEYHKLKKWAMYKACEGCYGTEDTKAYMIKVKTAVAKCMNVDAPELDLPMYKYRAVGALTHAAFDDDVPKLNHHSHPHSHSSNNNNDDDNMLESTLKKFFYKKLMAKFLSEMDDDEEDDDDMGPMRFFTNKKRRNRNKREDKSEMFELGDRLNIKLQQTRMKKQAEIGNFTCILRECGMIDASNQLNSAESIIENMAKIEFDADTEDGWLRAHVEKDVRMCHALATAVPDEVLEECIYGKDLGRVKMFKKCLKMKKLKTCMNFDIKKKLEANFGSIEDLKKTTELEEKELLPLVMELLHGPEMDM